MEIKLEAVEKVMELAGVDYYTAKEALVNAEGDIDKALESLNALCGVLGLLSKEKDDLTNEVRRMVEERAEARRNKDWKRSDELRDAIRAAGYILEDTKQGQKVRKNLDR